MRAVLCWYRFDVGILRVLVVAVLVTALVATVAAAADVRHDVDDASIARSSAALFRAFGDASLANGDRAAAKTWRDAASEQERAAGAIARSSTATSGSASPRHEDLRVSEARKRAIAYARDLAALLLAKAAALEDEERAAHPADYQFQSRGGTTPR